MGIESGWQLPAPGAGSPHASPSIPSVPSCPLCPCCRRSPSSSSSIPGCQPLASCGSISSRITSLPCLFSPTLWKTRPGGSSRALGRLSPLSPRGAVALLPPPPCGGRQVPVTALSPRCRWHRALPVALLESRLRLRPVVTSLSGVVGARACSGCWSLSQHLAGTNVTRTASPERPLCLWQWP